jgi:hypothetical protein
MLLIDDILVSEDLLKSHFICALNTCKGACCHEGDFGAPLTEEEKAILEKIYPQVKPYLDPSSIDRIEKTGMYTFYKEMNTWGTSLMENGACVFMCRNEEGVAYCGVEKAYHEGSTEFQKPVSCHLYPVRVISHEEQKFTAVNYDKWDICKAACSLGNQHKMPLYRFVKTALIRRFGESFYKQLEAAGMDLQDDKKS